jgi:N-acetylmuramoyl-L-alanine amidase
MKGGNNMYKVLIDSGHGSQDSGAIAINGEYEKDINLEVTMCLKRLLEPYKDKIEAIYTRTTDKRVSLKKRVEIANDNNVDLAISIHHNASGSGATGSETIHSMHGLKSRQIAELIMEEFNKLGQDSRRVFSRESKISPDKDYFYFIRYTNMPSVITEFAFIDSPDFNDINTQQERKSEAQAILNAILRYFNIPKQENWKEKILKQAYEEGLIMNYEHWQEKLDEPMPVWAVLAVLINSRG